MKLKEAVPVRCTEDRPHGQYELCGRLLCVVKDSIVYLRCDMCKTFYRLDILDNDNFTLTRVDDDKINFTQRVSFRGEGEVDDTTEL